MVSSGAIKGKTNVLEYAIEAVSQDLIDCRLQIVPVNSSKAKWYQERALSDQDEIIDRLIDARDGRILWTVHKPVRGWYLHLQLAPHLIHQEVSIPFQPVKNSQAGCTPLSICIGTRLDLDALTNVDEFIPKPLSSASTIHHSISAQEDGHFTALSFDTHQMPSSEIGLGCREIKPHARTSSRTFHQGHARRRSGVQSTSSTIPVPRHVSRSSQNGALKEDVEEGDSGQKAKREQNSTFQPQMCKFLLTNDPSFLLREEKGKGSWKRWAWNRIPNTIRIPLRLDSSRMFSILWIDAPLLGNAATHSNVIEVVQFEDDAGWLNWRGKRRGKILIQEEAIKALRLDLGFWIAVSMQKMVKKKKSSPPDDSSFLFARSHWHTSNS